MIQRKFNSRLSSQLLEDIHICFTQICWMCAGTFNITEHHIIPQEFNPVYNMTIPLCDLCHNKLHGRVLQIKKERQRKRLKCKSINTECILPE